jgi:trimeric autotransporter adhesin
MKRSLWQSRIASLVVSILLALGATAVQAAGAPSATTTAAGVTTQTGTTLYGTVTANGASTTVTFGYGLTSAYGTSFAATQSPLAGSASGAAVSIPIGGLSCNTLYHFHVTANNGTGGTIDGGDLTFTTSACPAGTPTATTTPPRLSRRPGPR